MTGDGTGETQYTTTSTVDSFVAAALGFTGRWCSPSARASASGTS
ncbi:hypothetical protein [Micromonospora siamensis]